MDTQFQEDRREEGSIGIGAMIVFIALILVAAVASTIIIKTAEELQQNAEATSDDTRKEISGKISILQVLVNTSSITTNAADTNVDSLIVTAKVASGSTDVLVNNVEWLLTCGDDSVYGVVSGNLGTDSSWGEAAGVGSGTGHPDTNAMSLDGTRLAATAELAAGTPFKFEIDLDKAVDGDAANGDDTHNGVQGADEGACNTVAGAGETLNLKMIVQEGGTTITELKIGSIAPGKEVV